jgi:hypothetical protein
MAQLRLAISGALTIPSSANNLFFAATIKLLKKEAAHDPLPGTSGYFGKSRKTDW